MQLSRSQNNTHAGRAARQNRTPEGLWSDSNSTEDVGHKREERRKAKWGTGAQGDPNPGPEGHMEEGTNYRDASPYQGEAEPPQPGGRTKQNAHPGTSKKEGFGQ